MPRRERTATSSTQRKLISAVATTAVVNVASTVLSAAAGILIARTLGPSGRGHYAAVTSWFGLALVIGEVGQTAATTYFVSRNPGRGRDVVATSRKLMVRTGAAATIVGIGLAPVLSHGHRDLLIAYATAFLSCLPSFVGASYTFSLQAVSLRRWNIVRIAQPLAYLATISSLAVAGGLTLEAVIATLAASVAGQALLAIYFCRRVGLGGGRPDAELGSAMFRYGATQLASAAPTVINTGLDQLLLSQVATAAALGYYAVAVTLTSLTTPIVAAIGNVLFPLLSRERSVSARSARERQAIIVAAILAALVLVAVVGPAYWLVPELFGKSFERSVPLVWLLAPGGLFLAVGLPAADLLRARGKPMAVAQAQGAGALVTVILLSTLLPVFGAAGAAVASSIAYGLTLAIMLMHLRRRHVEVSAENP